MRLEGFAEPTAVQVAAAMKIWENLPEEFTNKLLQDQIGEIDLKQ